LESQLAMKLSKCRISYLTSKACNILRGLGFSSWQAAVAGQACMWTLMTRAAQACAESAL
jgi:hypothetical protein